MKTKFLSILFFTLFSVSSALACNVLTTTQYNNLYTALESNVTSDDFVSYFRTVTVKKCLNFDQSKKILLLVKKQKNQDLMNRFMEILSERLEDSTNDLPTLKQLATS